MAWYTKIFLHQVILAIGQVISLFVSQKTRDAYMYLSVQNMDKKRYWCLLSSGLFNLNFDHYIVNAITIFVCSLFAEFATNRQYLFMLIASELLVNLAQTVLFKRVFKTDALSCGNSIQTYCLIGYSLMRGNVPMLYNIYREFKEIICREKGQVILRPWKLNDKGQTVNHFAHVMGFMIGIIFALAF